MPSSRDRSALFDIRDNAALARDFVGTLTLSEFKTDRRALYAATRPRNHIGGRTAAFSLGARAPSRASLARDIGVGNVLRHNYDDVAEEQVWRTVLEDLPALDRAIAAELERSE